MTFIRIILYPVSLLYGFITYLRNKLFDWSILRAVSFRIPVVSLGNLAMGGTGKTPHVEYLIRLLKNDFRIATLSRGYKRKTRGFELADENSSPSTVGDEAFQCKLSYPDVDVAVDERRVHGVARLQETIAGLEVILLDDAFQHRWIKPGLSILLTDFYHLYPADHVFPSGTLREFRLGAKRADIIVITKTPTVLSPITRQRIMNLINPGKHQALYFSTIRHGKLTRIPGVDFIPDEDFRHCAVLLFAGIANPYPLELYLKDQCAQLEHIYFPDHHMYSQKEMGQVLRTFDRMLSKNKIIVTTEKDMVRLLHPDMLSMIGHLPFCYVPIKIEFHDGDKELFDNQILNYVKSH